MWHTILLNKIKKEKIWTDYHASLTVNLQETAGFRAGGKWYDDSFRLDCYYELQSLMHQIKEEIEKYRQAYFDALED